MPTNTIQAKESFASLLRRAVAVMIGAVICAIGINVFLSPQGLLGGGITGIAMLINHFLKLPTWVSVLVLNLPLVVIGFFQISRRFMFLTTIGYLTFTAALALTEGIGTVPFENPLVAAMVAGSCTGLGVGIELRFGGSQGGFEILSVALYKKYNIQMSTMGTILNGTIIFMLTIISTFEQAVLSFVALMVNYKVLNMIQTGFNKTNTVWIVSDEWQQISERMMRSLNKAVTILHGEGAYSGQQREILYVVLRNAEISVMRDIIREIDPAAFVSIIDTKEAHGRTFEQWKTF